MVLKVCKRGVRTGNTLRASGTQHTRKYRSQSCILRQFFPNDYETDQKQTDELGELNFKENRVVYSLNKKRRWLLPDKLRHEVLDDADFDEHTNKQLKEYHKLRTNTAKCIGFASSDGQNEETGCRKTKSRRKKRGYFDVSSVLNEDKPNTNRNPNRNNTDDNNEVEAEEPPPRIPSQLNYQVLYPSPSTSYVSHCQKFIDYDKLDYWSYWSDRHNSRRLSTKLQKSICGSIRDSLEEMYYDFDDRFERDFDDDVDSEASARNITVRLDDMLHAKRTDNRVRQKRKSKSINAIRTESDMDINHKSHIIYTDVGSKSSEECSEKKHQKPDSYFLDRENTQLESAVQERKRKYTIVEPGTVYVSSEEAAVEVLKKKYGHKYLECNCYPRKFVIDITDEISKHSNTNIQPAKSSYEGAYCACLTFVKNGEEETKNKPTSKFLIYFNMQFSEDIDYVNISMVFDDATTDIDSIVKKAVSYVQSSSGMMIKKEKHHFRSIKHPSKSVLEACANWGCSSYIPDLDYLFRMFVHTQYHLDTFTKYTDFEIVTKADCLSGEVLDTYTAKDKFCSICYNSLGDLVPATALMSCGHWFCDSCWMEHIITKVQAGRTAILCPEFDCDEHVDMATLLSLLDLNNVIRYLRHCHDRNVEKLRVTNWCPNPLCGRVLKVNSVDVKTASCICGKRLCFECLKDVHWPADCTVAAAYRQKLHMNGDDDLVPVESHEPVTVSGKSCPSCKRFVEKNGGCPYMTCLCDNAFCWGCGKEWNSKDHGPSCYSDGYKDNHDTRDVTILSQDGTQLRNKRMTKWYKKAQWYKIAVEHRKLRQRIKHQSLRIAISKLTSVLVRYVSKAVKRKEPVSFDFEIPDRFYSCEAAKIRDFLKNTVDLYAELHEIVEHVAVFLDSTMLEHKSVLPIQNTLNKMTALSGFLYDILLEGYSWDEQYVFHKLKETRYKSRRCIIGLIKYFSQT